MGTTPAMGVVMGGPGGDMGGGAGLAEVVVVTGVAAAETAKSEYRPVYGANPASA